ncbi:MAG: LysM peptidoglycan-binding domain-containing protein, partial [Bdellovibrionales bacterium]|nr:LysM peptidoglycan-binding domain-containing protein [Bdellovibrionales bacterium]
FTRSTGRRYLRVSASIDERRDPIAASRAAARYLREAYERLGEWPLAITSYNHGVAGMSRAVRDTGSKDLAVIIRKYEGKTFGFASGNFFPSFIAALEVESRAAEYFPALKREKPLLFDELRLTGAKRFRDVLAAAKIDSELLQHFNPHLMRPVVRGGARIPAGVTIKVPRGSGHAVVARIRSGTLLDFEDHTERVLAGTVTEVKPTAVAGARHTVQPGETVGGIAARYHVASADLMEANGISDPRKLFAGRTIIIPEAFVETAKDHVVSVGVSQHVVVPGETLSGVASRYGMSLAELRRLNPQTDDTIVPGERIKVASAGTDAPLGQLQASAPAKMVTHEVESGDTLSEIAESFDVPVAAIVRANPQASSTIYPGEELTIPVKAAPSSAPETYTVRRGDSLTTIAKRFGSSVAELKRANPKLGRYLHPGDDLVIPQRLASASGASAEAAHTVARGDTLTGIASKFNVSVSEIRRANGLSGDRIFPGQTLRIPTAR